MPRPRGQMRRRCRTGGCLAPVARESRGPRPVSVCALPGMPAATISVMAISTAPFPPRVLVIDPDPRVCETVSALLEPYGFDCQTVGDRQEGAARLGEGGWDLVLTDLGV